MPASQCPPLGSRAPAFSIRTARETLSLDALHRQIVLLAFLSGSTPDVADGDILADIRAELRGLGAVLFAVSATGVFLFRPDDDVERFARTSDLAAADIDTAHVAFGLKRCAHAASCGLFLLDEERIVRFAHIWHDPDAVDLAAIRDALAIAGRTLVARPTPVVFHGAS